MSDFTSNACIVLSPARTGSQLIATTLAKKFYDDQPFVPESGCRAALQSRQRFVGHSHELFDAATLQLFVPVFSIRESVSDSVASRIIANHFRIWEPSDRTFESRTQKSFQANMIDVAQALEQQREWYCHYVHNLDDRSHVVSYEVFTSILANNSPERVDKTRTITNYQEVLTYVKDNMDQDFRAAHAEFVDWKCRPNRHAIYRLLQI